jgi:hypothetical protein
MPQDLITIELTTVQAALLRDVEKHYEVLGYLIGYMDMLNISSLKNMSITLDIDDNGVIKHTAFTSHYRK